MARDSHLEYEGSVTTEPTTGQGWSRTFFFDELSLIARRPLSLSLSLFKFARLIRIKLSLSVYSPIRLSLPFIAPLQTRLYSLSFYHPKLAGNKDPTAVKTRLDVRDGASYAKRCRPKRDARIQKKTHKHQHHHHRLCRNTTLPPPNQPTFALHLGRLDRLA